MEKIIRCVLHFNNCKAKDEVKVVNVNGTKKSCKAKRNSYISGLFFTKKYMDTGVEEIHLIEDSDIPDKLKKDINSWFKFLHEFDYVISNEDLHRLADLQGKYLARELFWNIICTQDIREENCEDEYSLKYYYKNIFDNELVWVLDWVDDEEINTFSGRCSLLY